MKLVEVFNNYPPYKTDLNRSKKTKWSKLQTIIMENCQQSLSLWKEDVSFYRALDKELLDGAIVDPSLVARPSRDYNNAYTFLVSELLPSWNGFPKRDHSIIFSSSEDATALYGKNIYTVLPFDGAKIVVTRSPDITSIVNGLGSPDIDAALLGSCLVYVGQTLKDVAKAFSDGSTHLHDLSIPQEFLLGNYTVAELKKYIDALTAATQYILKTDGKEKFLAYIENSTNYAGHATPKLVLNFAGSVPLLKNAITHFDGDILLSLNFFLSPLHNKVRLESTSSAPSKFPSHNETPREMWTDSKCVLLNVNHTHWLETAQT